MNNYSNTNNRAFIRSTRKNIMRV